MLAVVVTVAVLVAELTMGQYSLTLTHEIHQGLTHDPSVINKPV